MILRFVVVLWLASLALARPAISGPVDFLLVADEAALQPLVGQLASPQTETFGAWTLWRGTLGGRTVVLARSEGDPLNAVAATTLALRRYSPHLVITFGVARPYNPALQHGDVVVAERFVAFDGMVSPNTPIGGGSDPLQWKRLPHALMTPGEKEVYVDSFASDPAAISTALTLKTSNGRVVRGVLGSAAQVNREADRIAHLRSLWQVDTEDAESAFVAGGAKLFGFPVIGFRVIEGSPADAAAFALKFLEAAR